MPIQFSQVVAAQARGQSGLSLNAIDLHQLGGRASPIAVLDHFRVRGRPFPPHPHAGFSAVTYVFEDSRAGLRSRDSLGDDVVVGPGGIVWTHAGRGVIHEELPADNDRELHGLQIFVNLSSKNKLTAPQMLRLASSEVPEWRSDAGDRVRVVVGSFEAISSPLVPVEPFNLFDVELRHQISFDVEESHNTLVYVVDGAVRVRADGRAQTVPGKHAVALYGDTGRASIEAHHPAHVIILSGAEIRESVVVNGPFMMNNRSQIDGAVAGYQTGQMGNLGPASDTPDAIEDLRERGSTKPI